MKKIAVLLAAVMCLTACTPAAPGGETTAATEAETTETTAPTVLPRPLETTPKMSFINDEFDEDLYQEQLIRFLRCIRNFSENFENMAE